MDGATPDNDSRYRDLWLCFLSGQMSAAQLERHRRDDPRFDDYVRIRARQAQCSRPL